MSRILIRITLSFVFFILSSIALAESCLSTLEKEVPDLIPKGKKLSEVLKTPNGSKQISEWIALYDGFPKSVVDDLAKERELAKTAKRQKNENEIFATSENIKSYVQDLRFHKKNYRTWLLSCTLSGEEKPEIYQAAIKKLENTGKSNSVEALEPAAQ